ncbi:MAG TPA: DNA repair protein RecO [Planctomycetota bacterium]|jgi:DNA repair protein RecO (recombination protein O)|nr:DNA repair protein RecO [Planctomycetota bacterium]HZJ72560.1 DNA repair protein RecO [Planctomycetota bacterium]
MGTVTTEALALRRTPFGETSQVAEFMTRDRGRVSLILKGVHRERSRLGGPVDLLDHCRITWWERRGSRSLAPLRERKLLGHHPGMRRREDLLSAGLYLVELLQALAPEGQRMPALFELAVAYLAALDAAPEPASVPAVIFALEGGALRMAGLQPVLDRCVACDRRPSGHRVLRYDPGRGGIVCSTCRGTDDESQSLPAAAAGLIAELSDVDPRQASTLVIPQDLENDVRRFFYSTYLHVLERRPRCLVLPAER